VGPRAGLDKEARGKILCPRRVLSLFHTKILKPNNRYALRMMSTAVYWTLNERWSDGYEAGVDVLISQPYRNDSWTDPALLEVEKLRHILHGIHIPMFLSVTHPYAMQFMQFLPEGRRVEQKLASPMSISPILLSIYVANNNNFSYIK
jgi:hypothetical protein